MKTRTANLEDVAEFINGRAFKPSDWSRSGTPIIRIQNLTGTNEAFNYFDGPIDERVRVRDGDILISWSASLGVYRWHGDDAVLNQHIFKVRLNDDIDSQYFFYAATAALQEMESRVHGSTMQHITKDRFDSIQIPLPELSEQRWIAERLEQADGLRRTRRYALELSATFLPAAFLHLFGDLQHGKGEPVQLDDVAEILTGYPFTSEDYALDGETVKLCRGANVLPDRIDWSDLARWPASKTEELSDYKLEVGDIVMAMDRPWISEGFKVAQIQPEDCPAYLVQRVARLRGKDGVPNEFLYHLLRQPFFTRHCRPTETTIPHISPTDIQTFSFHLPPLALQQKFAGMVARVERLRAVQRESLRQAEHLFQSLLHEAFKPN